MISLTSIIAAGLDTTLDFSLATGLSAALCSSRELENDVIVRLLLGFQLPEGGVMNVNGLEPCSLNESQLTEFRREIGVIYHDGGLISNLNVWENLTLQFAYFSGLKKNEIIERGRGVLELVGYSGAVSLLPSRLSLFERRLVALARALMMEPSLLICQSVLDGLSREEQLHLSRLLTDYRTVSGARSLLVITSYPDSLHGLDLDFIYNTGGSLRS